MKVKDLINQLSAFDPDETVVMKNLYDNPNFPRVVMTKIRAYRWKGKIFVDGYDRIKEDL